MNRLFFAGLVICAGSIWMPARCQEITTGDSPEGDIKLDVARNALQKGQHNQVIRLISPLLTEVGEPQGFHANDPSAAWRQQATLLLGQAYFGKGKIDIADSILRGVERSAKDPTVLKVSRTTLANISLTKGRYAEAQTFCEDLLAQGASSPELFQTMGNVNRVLGRFEQSAIFLGEATNQTKYPQNKGAAELYLKLLYDIIETDVLRSKPEEATDEITESRRIVDQFYSDELLVKARNLEKIGSWQIFMKDYDKARVSLSSSRELYLEAGSKPRDHLALMLLQGYERRLTGNYQESLTFFDEAFDMISNKELRTNPYYADWLSRFLVLYIAMGNLERAEELILIAKENYLNQIRSFFPYLSEEEKELFYQGIRWRFEVFNSFAIQRFSGNPSIASVMFDNQMASKAILLSENNKWKSQILASRDIQLITQFSEWQKKKESLSKFYQEREREEEQIEILSTQIKALEKSLLKRSTHFSNLSEVKVYGWKDVQKKLKQNEAVVEIVRFRQFDFGIKNGFSDSLFYAALIVTSKTRDQPDLVVIRNGQKLENEYLNFYRNAIHFKRADTLSYEWFWADIHKKLEGVTRVYLSPDGAYHFVNVNTLMNPITERHLLNDQFVINLTNSKDLIKRHKESPGGYGILIGNPSFGTKEAIGLELTPLPQTELEIREIGRLMNEAGWETEEWLLEAATEGRIKHIFKPDVLHIASHGYFVEDNGGNPLFNSGVFLSVDANTEEDGKLTALEAMNLNLEQSQMVVLSACETGIGEYKNGEGVYGLQRALKVAGAQNLIMSLWKVDDQVTKDLMVVFYELWLGGQEIPEAFQSAQLRIKLQHPEPYFWGGFVLIGN